MNHNPVAIIIARGGSKRILGKNIKPFHGYPIISYPIRTALNSGIFQKVIVSTDSEQIASVAKGAGAKVPFMRPAELADDFTTTQDVLTHALQKMESLNEHYSLACCLYPTSVFLNQEKLKQGYDKIQTGDFQLVMSITEFDFPIQRALMRNEEGDLAYVHPEHELTRSNDLQERFHDAAQFYWFETKPFLKSGRLFSGRTGGVKIPRKDVVDIDTPEDWQLAERIYTLKLQDEHKATD